MHVDRSRLQICVSELPTAGSAAVEEAVDEALAQIVRVGSYLGEPERVKAAWLVWARCRLIDERRLAEFRNREVVEELDHALRVQIPRRDAAHRRRPPVVAHT